eukprot:SAG22_NODE_93_length_20834_cov_27.179503_2_plen_95_part_00
MAVFVASAEPAAASAASGEPAVSAGLTTEAAAEATLRARGPLALRELFLLAQGRDPVTEQQLGAGPGVKKLFNRMLYAMAAAGKRGGGYWALAG